MGTDFVSLEAASGIALLLGAAAALIWANTDTTGYASWWGRTLTIGSGDLAITETLVHWVNDALMTIFFFVVGLEIKRELVTGELRDDEPCRVARHRGDRRHGGAGRRLRPAQPRWHRPRRLGDPHGDRHRVRGRGAGDPRRPGAEQPEGLPPDVGHRRRHRRHHRDRALLLERDRAALAARRGRGRGARARDVAARDRPTARLRHPGRAPVVVPLRGGHRGHARGRGVGTAHAGAPPTRPSGARATRVGPAPGLELRDRARVRARQCRRGALAATRSTTRWPAG